MRARVIHCMCFLERNCAKGGEDGQVRREFEYVSMCLCMRVCMYIQDATTKEKEMLELHESESVLVCEREKVSCVTVRVYMRAYSPS